MHIFTPSWAQRHCYELVIDWRIRCVESTVDYMHHYTFCRIHSIDLAVDFMIRETSDRILIVCFWIDCVNSTNNCMFLDTLHRIGSRLSASRCDGLFLDQFGALGYDRPNQSMC